MNNKSLGIIFNKLTHKNFFGIDYSGAKDAGKKIWICEARLDQEVIEIIDIYSIYFKYALKDKKDSNAKLVELIMKNPNSVFGFDFAFSIPFNRKLIPSSWREFIEKFPEKFPSELKFRKELVATFKEEKKRDCDRLAKTPFSPYNLRMFRQTYFGITGIIKPIIELENISIIPFNEFEKKNSIIMEICPASLLKTLPKAMQLHYKGKAEIHGQAREEILKYLKKEINLKFLKPNLEIKIKNDSQGDALDSLLSIICSLKGLSDLDSAKINNPNSDKEGYVYH